MLSKKQVFLRCLALVLGLVLGLGASYTTWQIKSYFSSPSSSVSKSDTEKFLKSDFWDKATVYFEGESKNFLDNYMNIYQSYGLMDTIDRKLTPYFEKYGYTTVLSSGLKSKNILANTYCIEKSCELYGEDLYDKEEIKSALQSVQVNKTPITNEPDESIYISLIQQRIKLLGSLIDESYSSKKIIKNNIKTRMAWVSNCMNGAEKIRVYDNGVFYTVDDIDFSSTMVMYFASDDSIVIDDISEYVIHLKNSLAIYDIQSIIKDFLNLYDQYIEVYSIKVHDNCILADFGSVINSNSSVHIQKYTLSHNLITQKTEIIS